MLGVQHEDTRGAVSIGEPNTHRLTQALFGAFSPFRLDGRQPICVSKRKNHSKISPRQVRAVLTGLIFVQE